ncbi:alpha-glucosidase [Mycetocola lacteus]|uniref:Alpha-glucosidase n=1 Tax=Mycetocola lacteus TaxID=76637 RepID=A0A3L7AMC2_9MICO|nr:alpha-glucosidase [Mycetocola lacteus]RLP84546.1 alpha-glucosidase [Mycetocola lacteus]
MSRTVEHHTTAAVDSPEASIDALGTLLTPSTNSWWRGDTIYQIYPRSFADGNGDGTGDLRGVRQRLPYLKELGINAIWYTPWYESPLADGGYDVADYRRIDPAFGDLAEAEALIQDALALGIRTIVDVVPNHVSAAHRWFQQALAAEPGSPERARFWFHPGLGENGDQPPTHWPNNFAGPTWTRLTNEDGTPGEWYLHLFDPEQPDLNWSHPEVVQEHEDILRFWFDRGVAGIRIDSAALLVKDPALPEIPENPGPGEHPNTDRDELHTIYRGWRRVAEEYRDRAPLGGRALIGEIWLPDAERFAAYLRPDEMHTAFNFDFMTRQWKAEELRASIDLMRDAHAPIGAPCTWVLSNHDVTRVVTRYGREDSSFEFLKKRRGIPTDLALGTRRARAAALLTAALPGSLYIWQGDELGLPEVEDLPDEERQDPMFHRSNGVDPGRDGCRVPLPWSGQEPPFGFEPEGSTAPTWLSQPADWNTYTVEAQRKDPGSMLNLYRRMLEFRERDAALGDGPFRWLTAADHAGFGPEVLAFARADGFISVTNFSGEPFALPERAQLLLSSSPLEGGLLPADTTAWLRLTQHPSRTN